jgi:EAL and modified HD-GYP domain-containing signal transduction protein
MVDGFNIDSIESPIMNLTDIFAVDFRLEKIKDKNSIFATEDKQKIKLLAREVETETDFELALSKGFDYFQGNFFTRPDIIPTENIPSFKMNLIKLLDELNKPELDFAKIEETLKRDVALTYKLFRFMNSASLGVKTTINSINHALNLLGEVEVKKWLSIMVVSSVSSDKPVELLKLSLIRAKFCELIAEELGIEDEKNDYFLTGMFSLMDTFIGRPLSELIIELPLKVNIKKRLLNEDNHLRKVLELVKDYENGRWLDVKQGILRAELKQEKITEFYNKSINWSGFLKE